MAISNVASKRAYILVFVAIVAASALTGVLYLLREKPPVKVGFIGTLTGTGSEWGIGPRNGALLAIEAANTAGGIRGHKIEFIAKDDLLDPKRAGRQVKELIDAGVVAIIGPTSSAAAVEALPVANERKMLLIAPTVSSEAFTGKDDFLIRTATLDSALGRDLATYLYNTQHWRTIAAAIETSNRAYAEDAYSNFRKHFEALGGRVLDPIEFKQGSGHAEVARKLTAQPVDGIYLVAYDIDTAYICQELRKLGSTLTVAESAISLTDALIGHGGAAVDGMLVPQTVFVEPDNKKLEHIRELYRHRFGEQPSNVVGFGYDAANVLIEALKRSRSWTPSALKDTILRIKQFKSVFGDFEFDAYGDTWRPSIIVTVQNGKFVRAP